MITVGLYGIADTTHGRGPTYTHDHGLALMRGGRVITTVQLERWTGVKHDNGLPARVTEVLAALLPPDEPVRFASVSSFLGASFVSADGNIRIEPDGHAAIEPILTPARVAFYPDGLSRRPAGAHVVSHEFAHLAALLPFVGRFEEGALLVHVDGGASDSACSFWQMTPGGPRLLESSWDRLKRPVNHFNASPLARAILGLGAGDHLSMPGKLMGYAAWGNADPGKSAWLEENGFFLDGPDDPGALLAAIERRFGPRPGGLDLRDPVMQDLCACLQAHFEEQVTSAIAERQARTGAKVLYYSGGGAQNIPTNARLEALFDRVHVPPCPSDAGLALGAAAWLELLEYGELPRHSPFLEAYGAAEGAPREDAVGEVARLLAEGAVVGVCNGAGEVGPRALGHRSLLARPDDVALRRRVSEVVKRREWYRPVAPVLCAEVAEEALGPAVTRSALAPWMLGAWRLRPGWEGRFRGVVHEDGTVRAQVVARDDPDNKWLYTLLVRMWREHGVFGLVNTSFNVQGKPMVQRHEDAPGAARAMGLDAVVVHGELRRG